ncbi:MAG: hypothetical protein WCH99_04355 [Verrucomicrobiota bacterium]
MNLPTDILAAPGKTLFMVAANPRAVLVTRQGTKLRKRTMNFVDEHRALDWALKCQAIFVLMPRLADFKFN